MAIKKQFFQVPLVIVVDDDPSTFQAIRRIGRSENYETHAFKRIPSPQELKALGLVTDIGRPCCIVFESSHVEEITGLNDQTRFSWSMGICLCRNIQLLATLRTMMTAPFIFVEKPFSIATMVELLHQSMHNSPPRLPLLDIQDLNGRIECLTLREREIYEQISQGRSGKEIAGRLGISTKTFYVHRANMMQKIGIRSVTGLARLCTLVAVPFRTPRN